MARNLTPRQIAEKHARRTSAAVEDMKAGVNALTVNPMEQAAGALDKAALNYQEAVSSGRMARRLRSVSLEEWKRQMVEKGASRVASGVQASLDKTTGFWEEFQPHYQRVQQQVRAMSNLTIDDSINRMVANARMMHEFKRGGRGGR